MKIIDARAHVLRSPLEQPFAFSQGWVASRGATLVEITTDAGLTGWGERAPTPGGVTSGAALKSTA